MIPWIEKYRPKKIDDISHNEELKNLFKNSIKTGNITHFIFYGPPGTGKTSAILSIGREIFKEFYSKRVIEFNASDDRGINAVRGKISNEAKKQVSDSVSKDGTVIPPYKIIVLDEADSMTDEAQDALRVIIEQHSAVTRFCFICNYICKITDAIKSRCTCIFFKKIDDNDVKIKLIEIATKENMNLTDPVIDTIIEISNGDMRKSIMILQNLKYLYDYKSDFNQSLCELEWYKLRPICDLSQKKEPVSIKDIYTISASIDVQTANNIINDTLNCSGIVEISNITKKVLAFGLPIDNIISQLNKSIINHDILTEVMKAKIIKYSGNILMKMKKSSNEYLQLLDYLSAVYGIKNNISTYN